MELSLQVQDWITTAVAASAAIVLLWRTISIFSSSKDQPGCDACSGCAAPVPDAAQRGSEVPAPMVFLRRPPVTDRR